MNNCKVIETESLIDLMQLLTEGNWTRVRQRVGEVPNHYTIRKIRDALQCCLVSVVCPEEQSL